MNYTETFDQFATKVSPTDLALYAGAALILFVLFKDKLSPVQTLISGVTDKLKGLLGSIAPSVNVKRDQDLFFQLVQSWKQTRDLAVKSGCSEAVKVADQMFPFLSPTGCSKDNT
jgi:hypothetical protein